MKLNIIFHKQIIMSREKTYNSDYVFLIGTDLLMLPAQAIALIYRSRWQTELFS